MPLVLGGSAVVTPPYSIDNSCRFDAASSTSMLKISSAGDQDKWTLSMWVKRSAISATQYMTSWYQDNSNYTAVYFEADDTINFLNQIGGGISGKLNTTRVFRDPSAWYHIVAVYDSGNAEAGDRQQIWVNGVRETDFITESNVSLNEDSIGNKSGDDTILGQKGDGGVYLSGYLAEVVLLDGTAATPTSFGEFNSASPTIWQPIDVSGLTFGTNGFHCDFEDSANLGNDANGGTDLTETNFAAVDQATDSPTNNFPTANPLSGNAEGFAEGNLKVTDRASTDYSFGACSTMGAKKGKWYTEIKCGNVGAFFHIGILREGSEMSIAGDYPNGAGNLTYRSNGQVCVNAAAAVSWASTYSSGDIIGIAMDLENQFLYFAKNGTWQDSGDPTSGASGTGTAFASSDFSDDTYYFPYQAGYNTGIGEYNFGGCSVSAIASGNADANGYGNFEYAVPSGYYALCSKNLAEFGG